MCSCNFGTFNLKLSLPKFLISPNRNLFSVAEEVGKARCQRTSEVLFKIDFKAAKTGFFGTVNTTKSAIIEAM